MLKSLKPIETVSYEELEATNELSSLPDSSYVLHFLWVEGPLSNIERICINSFVINGFEVVLWHYGDVPNAPDGVLLRDANEVLPKDRVFRYKNGSLAGFADLFRYTVLSELGGIWADTDLVCLSSANDFKKMTKGFFVSELLKGRQMINNNFIFWPSPQKGDIIDIARAVANTFAVDTLKWGDCGPKLLHSLVVTYPHISPSLVDYMFCNSIEYKKCPQHFVEDGHTIPSKAKFLHFYNETWRRDGLSKDVEYPSSCIAGLLKEKFLDVPKC